MLKNCVYVSLLSYTFNTHILATPHTGSRLLCMVAQSLCLTGHTNSALLLSQSTLLCFLHNPIIFCIVCFQCPHLYEELIYCRTESKSALYIEQNCKLHSLLYNEGKSKIFEFKKKHILLQQFLSVGKEIVDKFYF